MQSRIELELEHIHERLRSARVRAEHQRQVAACTRTQALLRRAARPLAHTLLRLGGRLLRYANGNITPPPRRPPTRAAGLN